MRAETDRVNLFQAFVTQPHIDDIAREHVAFQEEIVIRFECIEDLAQTARCLGDLGQVRGWQVVEIQSATTPPVLMSTPFVAMARRSRSTFHT